MNRALSIWFDRETGQVQFVFRYELETAEMARAFAYGWKECSWFVNPSYDGFLIWNDTDLTAHPLRFDYLESVSEEIKSGLSWLKEQAGEDPVKLVAQMAMGSGFWVLGSGFWV